MIRLSVVIITLNEEERIGRCIDSVKDIADEILIVDSYSTDNTQKIAESKGARFIQNEFAGHIQQKNFGVKAAAYDHILSLDADEALDDFAASEVKKVKSDWTYDSYTFNRLTNYCGQWIKHCGWYPDRKIRLFDRKKAKWGGVNPHDKVEIDSDASNQRLRGDILHYSYPTISLHAKTAESFSDIASKAAINQGKSVSFAKVIMNPFFTFMKKYFFQLGFLDGYYGFVICILSAHSSFLKYIKIWQLSREDSHLKNG